VANQLEKALERARYSALPLPRAKSDPTTVFAFEDGSLYIVRNPHTCLPNPPLATTVDPAVDTIQFTKEFSFELKGIASFMMKIFGLGSAKAELEAKRITSAMVQMGGLAHHTIETGALIDYLIAAPATTCRRDVLDPKHFTIVAALQATTFTYTFKTDQGAIVKLSGADARNLFQVGADTSVSVTEEGRIVISAPRFVGVVTWDGKKIQQELERARKAAGTLRLASPRIPSALENAVKPGQLRATQLASMGRISSPRSLSTRSRKARPAKRK
jgi:hypothetical protein